MTHKKLVLLDIDDTICNASQAYGLAQKACCRFLRKKYPALTESAFNKAYSLGRQEIHSRLDGTASMHNRFLYFQKMSEFFGLRLKPELLGALDTIYWETTLKKLRLFPGVKKTLRILKENNIKIGVVSDLLASIQIKKLEKLEIAQFIDFVASSEEAGGEKPRRKIFLLALKKANCTPKEAVMVGDSIEKDVLGSKAAGIAPVFIGKGKCGKEDYSIKRFDEMTRILKVKPQKQSKKRKIIAFDLMGTIFDEGHIIRKLLFPLMKKSGKKIPYQKLKELYVQYSQGRISKARFNKTVPEETEEKFLDTIKLDKNAVKLLKTLKRKKIGIGILSNVPEAWGKKLLEKFGIMPYFQTIMFSAQFGSRKPDEGLYAAFVAKARVLPKNCYFVDDNISSLKEARLSEMKTILVKKEKSEELFIPDFIITDIRQLEKIV